MATGQRPCGLDDRRVRQHPARGRSHRRAILSRSSQSSRTTAMPRRVCTRWMPDVRRHGSGRGWRPGREHRGELLPGPLGLALLRQLRREGVPQLDQNLHVQRGVTEPFGGQRPGGPVRRRVALLEREAEHGLHQHTEPDPWVAQQAAGEFGVEQLARPVPEFGQAGQVLGGRVQHGLRAGQRRVERRQVRAGDRIDQHRARAPPAQLHQEGAVPVAVAGGALGVDRDRALACASLATASVSASAVATSGGSPSRGSSSGTAVRPSLGRLVLRPSFSWQSPWAALRLPRAPLGEQCPPSWAAPPGRRPERGHPRHQRGQSGGGAHRPAPGGEVAVQPRLRWLGLAGSAWPPPARPPASPPATRTPAARSRSPADPPVWRRIPR